MMTLLALPNINFDVFYSANGTRCDVYYYNDLGIPSVEFAATSRGRKIKPIR
jgi:hypothetical protein